MTFCSQAIEDLKKYRSAITGQLIRGSVDEYVELFNNSIKFKLPDGGELINVKLGENLGGMFQKHQMPMRLPFPVIALEYDITGRFKDEARYDGDLIDFDRSIIIAKEMEDGIAVIPFARCLLPVMGRVWWPSNFVGLINNNHEVGCLPITRTGHLLKDNQSAFDNDISGEISILCCFLLALGCANTGLETIEPPLKLNQKRERVGKAPFFSYKILTIPGSVSANTNLGGTHASPRVHLRRGHIRHLKDKNIWINSMVVGNKSKGMVHKDYEVQTQGDFHG